MRYQEVYPSPPAIDSNDIARRSAAELLTLEFFEAQPGEIPTEVYTQHHVLLNLKDQPHRVENWRGGEHRDFVFHKNEVVVTPAGVASGWRWHEQSRVIVITLDPDKLARFAQQEVGLKLTPQQLADEPQFKDEDLVQTASLMCDALKATIGSAVLFESLARVFLVKLLERYGQQADPQRAFSDSFTPHDFHRVLDYIADHFNEGITVDDLAEQAAISTFHFSRLFKKTIGETPYQFLVAYRVERAKGLLAKPDIPLIDIALACGFSDQAHFSRMFKKSTGQSPKVWRGNA